MSGRAMGWTCLLTAAVAYFVGSLFIPDIGGWIALIPVVFAALAWSVYRRRSTWNAAGRRGGVSRAPSMS